MGEFALGMFVMGLLVMAACIVIMRRQNKQMRFSMTPPDDLTFELPQEMKYPKEGESVWVRKTEYVSKGMHGQRIFLKRKDVT